MARTPWRWLSIPLIKILSFITFYTPYQIGYLLCDWIGNLIYIVSVDYRRAVMDNIRHVHRGQIDEERLRRQTRMVFRTSARNFWDLACVPYLSQQELQEMYRLETGSWEILDEIMESDKGAILVTSHLGAFDFIGQYVAVRYRPITLTAPTVSPFMFAAVNYLRSSIGARMEVVSTGTLRRMIRALRNGEMVLLAIDRDYAHTGQPVTLFGSETTLPAAPIRLARDTGVPIVPVFTLRDDVVAHARRFAYHVGPPISIERTDDRRADVQRGMRRVADTLEYYISRAPEQWVMFQPVWPKPLRSDQASTSRPSVDTLSGPLRPEERVSGVTLLDDEVDQPAGYVDLLDD